MLRTSQFYRLWLMFILAASAGLMIIAHVAIIAKEQARWEWGFVPVVLLAIFNSAGRVASGIVSDRIGRTQTMVLAFVLQACNMFAFSHYTSSALLVFGSAFTGLCYGTIFTLMPAATADFYGVKNLGVNYGFVFTGFGVAGVFGPLLGGKIRDVTGTYSTSYTISAVMLLVGAALAFTTRAPLYAVASVIGPANDFQAANSELFMNLPLVAALWLAARVWVRGRATDSESFALGVLVGVAVLIRPQAALALLPMAVVAIRRTVKLKSVAIAAAGALLPLWAMVAWLWHADALADAATSLAYSRYYAHSLPFEVKLANGTLKTLFFLAIDVGLVIPVVALIVRGRRQDAVWRSGAGCLLVSWLLASFIAVGMGGRFYPHYFIQVLPPLAITAARQLTVWRREVA
jgi:4-amino-4-deoxy-L-arabinose transferase-like glycosyltransferase